MTRIVDIEEKINAFAKNHPKKMLPLNPLSLLFCLIVVITHCNFVKIKLEVCLQQ